MTSEDGLNVVKVSGAGAAGWISSVADFCSTIIPILTAGYISLKIIEWFVKMVRAWRKNHKQSKKEVTK